jgi:hypothetical protein
MIKCQAMLGDTLVQLIEVLGGDREETPFSYELHFRDLPTGESEVLVIHEGENAAVLAFAAWLAVDEQPGWFEQRRNSLYERIKAKKKFLP